MERRNRHADARGRGIAGSPVPPEDRARLAEILLESFVPVSSPSVEAAWDAEIQMRVVAYERGDLELIPAEDVFARARKFAG
jgi:putative addiction module component (TIGR02574 family)